MDIQSILLITVFATNIFLSMFVYFHKESNSGLNSTFALLSLNVSLWVVTAFFYRQVTSPDQIFVLLKVLYLVPIFIPVIFLYFTAIFTKTKFVISTKVIKWLLIVTSFAFALMLIFTNNFVIDAYAPVHGEKIITFGPLYGLYVAYFSIFFLAAFSLLIKRYLLTKDNEIKVKLKYIFFGTFLSSTLGMITNLVLPWYGFFELNWLGNVLTVFFIGFITYAIIKYKLLNVKTFTAELLILLIIIASLVQISLAKSVMELVTTTSILVLIAFFGFLLVRSIYKEVETRERVEGLAFDIAIANKKLRKMERQKSEFVSIASHQLRTPLTAIKGYASMLIEGSFGEISVKLKEAIEKIYQSSETLVVVIEDFLIISRIEQGRMHYELAEVDVGIVVEEVVNIVGQDAERKSIAMNISFEKSEKYLIYADYLKIKQVIRNIVDNAVQYTEKGSVSVSVTINKKDRKIRITISDTGIGIDKDAMPGLFEKFSDWGEDKMTSGVGLYVANEIVKAHRGKIWAESDGLGHGSTFFIELSKK